MPDQITLPDSMQEYSPVIITPQLYLVPPLARDADRVLAFMEENREHLGPWDPPKPEDFYTREFWSRMFRQKPDMSKPLQGLRLALLLRSDPTGPMIGTCNLNNIVRGAFQAAHLGYSIDHRYQGKGLMSEAVEHVVQYAFEELRLHRVMANYMPTNVRSGRLLRRLGFVVEGYAHDYLLIDGEWRDHILTSRTNPDWKPA